MIQPLEVASRYRDPQLQNHSLHSRRSVWVIQPLTFVSFLDLSLRQLLNSSHVQDVYFMKTTSMTSCWTGCAVAQHVEIFV